MFRKKVLVIGGAGFIGSHLKGEQVLDLKNGQDVRDGIPGQYDTIVFLAVDMGKTKEAYDYNHLLYEQLREYCLLYPNTHVIYTSSAAVYPDVNHPVSELTPPAPVNLYGKSKLLGECYVQQFRHHTILRLANVYGEGGKGAIDLFRNGELCIFGDGTQIRDYVSVEKVVKTIKTAIKYPQLWQGITNVSTGIGWQTKDVFTAYSPNTQPKFLAPREGDVQHSVLDNHKLRLLNGE